MAGGGLGVFPQSLPRGQRVARGVEGPIWAPKKTACGGLFRVPRAELLFDCIIWFIIKQLRFLLTHISETFPKQQG